MDRSPHHTRAVLCNEFEHLGLSLLENGNGLEFRLADVAKDLLASDFSGAQNNVDAQLPIDLGVVRALDKAHHTRCSFPLGQKP